MKTTSREPEAASAADHSHTLIRETLLQIARERRVLDPRAGSALFAMVEAAGAVRRYLHGALATIGLTDAKFRVLIVLHRFDPETLTAADLAYHAGVSRSAMTDIIDQLVGQGWVERERALEDRRTVRIGFAATGREMAERAIEAFMAATARLLAHLPESIEPALAELCSALRARLEHAADATARASEQAE